jgi:hypothetical protein
MRKLFLVLFVMSLILVSCNNSEKDENIVERYIDAYNNRDYDKIKEIIDDSIKLVNYHGYVEASNKDDFFETAVEWGDLFGSKSEILEMEEQDSIIKTLETDSNLYYQFLYGDKQKMKFTYFIKNDKITRIEYDTLPGFSLLVVPAAERYSKFAEWVFMNYPQDIIIFEKDTPENLQKKRDFLMEYLHL